MRNPPEVIPFGIEKAGLDSGEEGCSIFSYIRHSGMLNEVQWDALCNVDEHMDRNWYSQKRVNMKEKQRLHIGVYTRRRYTKECTRGGSVHRERNITHGENYTQRGEHEEYT